MANTNHVVVPGTFDPITYGHLDVIRRAANLFDKVTVAVAKSASKRGVGTEFSLEDRLSMAQEALAEQGISGNVEVVAFEGLLVDFCHEICAGAVVKGLRATMDFEYELQQADLNFRMAPDIESVFIMSNPEFGFVSSSVVKEIASLGSDVHLLVSPSVEKRLVAHYA